MPGLIGQVYPIAPVAPDSVNEYALNVPELQAAGLLPTAWCVFDGTLIGINAPIAGYNVASIERTSIGIYIITFSSPMDNVNYSVSGSSVGSTSPSHRSYVASGGSIVAVGTAQVAVSDAGSTLVDINRISVQFVGGKN